MSYVFVLWWCNLGQSRISVHVTDLVHYAHIVRQRCWSIPESQAGEQFREKVAAVPYWHWTWRARPALGKGNELKSCRNYPFSSADSCPWQRAPFGVPNPSIGVEKFMVIRMHVSGLQSRTLVRLAGLLQAGDLPVHDLLSVISSGCMLRIHQKMYHQMHHQDKCGGLVERGDPGLGKDFY